MSDLDLWLSISRADRDRAEAIATIVANRCEGEKKGRAPQRYSTIWQAARLGAIEVLAEVERLTAINAELVAALYQYRDDLRHPPAADSIDRRLTRVGALIAKAGAA